MELWGIASATPPVGPQVTGFLGLITKTPFAVNWISADVGKVGFLYARWVTRRGLVGPWSPLVGGGII